MSVDVFKAGALDWYLKPWSEEVDASGRAKATTINRRRSTTSLMPKRIRRLVTKDRRSRGSLNKGRVFRLNRIKVRSLESAIFKLAL